MSESCCCLSAWKSQARLLATLITNCFGHAADNLVRTFAGFRARIHRRSEMTAVWQPGRWLLEIGSSPYSSSRASTGKFRLV